MPRSVDHQPDQLLSQGAADLGAPASHESGPIVCAAVGHRSATACAREGLCLLKLWRQRVSDRRELFELTDAELHDFGATRCEVMREYGKPFWRA
ncbi:hypothetical protein [Mesorhizobium sp.]|uniref:DUF1127 domain-containing protein n=1 Tax=Mesorhizobium sp. TaxID=1871066 RepID=UPI0025DD315D|nr:hypothetical protein [Mesorhizobium sp.]